MPGTTTPAKKSWRKSLVTMALWLAGGYCAICLLAYFFQKRMIYLPRAGITLTPKAALLDYEDLTLTTADGLRINAWFVPAKKDPRATVLFCHGNAGNLSNRIDHLRLLHQLGLDVCIFDYRGYGLSEGSPDEEGTYTDAEAVWDYLVTVRKVPPRNIILFGNSLGTGVAVELAARKKEAGGLVLSSPFSSTADVAARLYWLLPVRLILTVRYDSKEKVGGITAPKLFFHSKNDTLLPYSLARRLFDRAAEPKQFVDIHGDHNNGIFESKDLFRNAMKEFLEKHFAPE